MTCAEARSWLFVPGDRPERFAKAAAAGADQIILDLEDAVLPEAKPAARAHLAAFFAEGGQAAVRINAPGTPWFAADLAMVQAAPGLTALIVPKTEARLLPHLPVGQRFVGLIETARGLLDLAQLCTDPRVERLMFGSVDFSHDTGAAEGSAVMAAARSALVLQAAAAGLPGPVEGVSLDLAGGTELYESTRRAAAEGFTGRLAIHPRQIAAIHQGFAPSEEDLAQARALLAAAAASDQGALRYEGKLIDRPVLERAKRLISRAAG